MKGPNTSTLRALLPAAAVIGVLALSLVAMVASFGALNAVGYGYGNNCGVKGSGMHDHGKPCPNRPFPGKGKGLSNARTEGETLTGEGTSTNLTVNAEGSLVMSPSATSGLTLGLTTSGKKHGHGKGHAFGHDV